MADAWSSFYWGDYRRKTSHLSLAEHGAYILLMQHYYSTGLPLPGDKPQLYRIASALDDGERGAVDRVIGEFFNLQDGGYHNRRCDKELEKSAQVSKARQDAANAKWGKDGNAESSMLRSQRLAEARKLGRHTQAEWSALLQVCGPLCVRCNSAYKTPAGTPAPVRDHIKPIYQGGSDAIENIQPLCIRCNSSKGRESIDYRPTDWRERLQRCLQDASQPQSQPQKKENTTSILTPPNPTTKNDSDAFNGSDAFNHSVGLFPIKRRSTSASAERLYFKAIGEIRGGGSDADAVARMDKAIAAYVAEEGEYCFGFERFLRDGIWKGLLNDVPKETPSLKEQDARDQARMKAATGMTDEEYGKHKAEMLRRRRGE